MSEYKYTSDGRKVVIVGKLNAQETIVQEVFVSESGAEVASGENFVVKSLHDEPVESWKEKNLREIEERYDEKRKSFEEAEKRLAQERQVIDLLIKDAEKTQKGLNLRDLDVLFQFLAGEIKYVVEDGFHIAIHKLNDALERRYYWDCSLKLVSLFGDANGNLKWGINQYGDGSGSYVKVTPCKTLSDAKALVESLIGAKEKVNEYDIEVSKKYGLNVPTNEQLVKYYAERKRVSEDRIEHWQKEIDAEKAKCLEHQQKIDEHGDE